MSGCFCITTYFLIHVFRCIKVNIIISDQIQFNTEAGVVIQKSRISFWHDDIADLIIY